MGIRFHCPNGHHLNVKSYLAGERGLCPRCGVPVDIPLVDSPGEPIGEGSVFLPTTRNTPLSAPAAPVEESPLAPAVTGASEAAVTASPNADPLSEAPEAAWYVRSPAGGQYGPAPRDVLRQWLGEGRISADSLLWRDGWPDWRLASELFPALPKAAEVETTNVSPGIAPAEVAGLRELAPSEHNAEPVGRRKRRSSEMAVWTVVILAITSVVLFGALLYVVMGRELIRSPDPPSLTANPFAARDGTASR